MKSLYVELPAYHSIAHALHKELFTRVTKPLARSLFENGKEIRLCPVRLDPASPWGVVIPMLKDENFEAQVNTFTIYICRNTETGRYPMCLARYADLPNA